MHMMGSVCLCVGGRVRVCVSVCVGVCVWGRVRGCELTREVQMTSLS